MSNLFLELAQEAEKQQKQLEESRKTSELKPSAPVSQTITRKFEKDTNSNSVTSEVPNSVTTELRKPVSSAVRELQSYGLTNYDKLFRLDARLTYDQIAFLNKLEAEIKLARPDVERNHPDHKRITKNSIVRVLVEIARQIELQVDASQFYNELDLFHAVYLEFRNVFSKKPNTQ